MTDSIRLFRAGVLAGSFLSAVLVSGAQQPQQPQSLPRPRYQSPGVPAQEPVQAPRPQLAGLPKTPAITPNAEVVEDVIVRVNDNIISRSDLERAEVGLQQELQQNPNAGDATERQKNLLRDLIDQQLLLSKGKDLNINPDAEVVRRLDEIRKQNNIPSMDALEQAVRAQGLNFEDFRANIRNSIITGQVVRDEVGRTVSQHMTDAEQRKYYEAHKADFDQPEQVRLSEILVPTAANADDAGIAAAQKKAQAIYDKLKGGADFAATAKAESGGPTAAQGGDLGQFKRGALAPVLEEKTFALPVGGYTEPTRTRQGFVILKATEHQQAGTPPFAQVQNEVQNAMYQQEITPALRDYLTRLREDAYIDLRPGFVDSGASAKQTKPVFAAYVPPVPKKKTEKQRMEAATTGRLSQQTRGTVAPATQVLDKNGKPKKAKRQKIRFGQAPQLALPDSPAGATTTATGEAAPGQAISPLETASNTVAAGADTDTDAFAPKAAPEKKTRYSSREPEVKAKKAATVQAKAADKAKATPVAADSTEKQEKSIQADALGLNGSDAKKKKAKRKKGDPKIRKQETVEQPKAPLQDNGLPDRLHQLDGPPVPTTPTTTRSEKKPSSDTTTLAPNTQPAPGQPGVNPTPATNGAVGPTSDQPVPQTTQQPR